MAPDMGFRVQLACCMYKGAVTAPRVGFANNNSKRWQEIVLENLNLVFTVSSSENMWWSSDPRTWMNP